MEIIAVNRDNITTEHICCAISDKKRGMLRIIQEGMDDQTV